jgi:hypothetical protein
MMSSSLQRCRMGDVFYDRCEVECTRNRVLMLIGDLVAGLTTPKCDRHRLSCELSYKSITCIKGGL